MIGVVDAVPLREKWGEVARGNNRLPSKFEGSTVKAREQLNWKEYLHILLGNLHGSGLFFLTIR